jgi:hypothetical protein
MLKNLVLNNRTSRPGMTFMVIILAFWFVNSMGQRVYDVTEFGAIGDGNSLNTIAIQSAIEKAFEEGGGRVLIPSGGVFKTGTIQIKSKVTLEVNGTILGTEDTSIVNYPQIDPGYESFCTRPDVYPRKVLIYAKQAKDVGLIGTGTIDGNGMHPNLELGHVMENRMKAINGIRFMMCTNVQIRGESEDQMLTVTNTGHWALNPMNCDTVHIQYLKVAEYGGITPDGLPITDCRNVLVEDCYISSDDDACTLKNGSPHITVSNIAIKRTVLESGVTPNKFGSPQSFGPFKNIKIIGCTYRTVPASLGKTYQIYSEGFFIGVLNGGGSVENVLVEDAIIEGTKHPFALYVANIRSGYWAEWWKGRRTPTEFGTIKNITIRNLSYRNPNNNGVLIEGRRGNEIENLLLENVYLPSSGGATVHPIPEEKTQAYPLSPNIYGQLPAYGFFIRNARNIQMKNVWCWPQSSEPRNCLVHENVTNIDSSGLHYGSAPDNMLPAIYFEDLEAETIISALGELTIKANGRDHDGTITNVKLEINGVKVGELSSAPFCWTGDNTLFRFNQGKNRIKLLATDNMGGTSSATIEVTVKDVAENKL